MSEKTAEDIPTAVSEGSFIVGGVTLRTYMLSDGRRIINADDVAELFSDGLAAASEDELRAFAAFVQGASQ